MQDYDRRLRVFVALVFVWSGLTAVMLGAQQTQAAQPPQTADTGAAATVPDYVIGVGDQLQIKVWREPEMSADVVVLPNGKITVPLANEVEVSGLTIEEVRHKLRELLIPFHEDPVVSVVVAQINSRKVFITGMVAKPGEYALLRPTTVVQLVAMAGGLAEWAEKKIIVIRGSQMRPDGVPWSWEINYDDITQRRNLQDNILLEPGDTVIVR